MTTKVTTVKLGPGTLTFGEADSLTRWEGQVTTCQVVPEVKTDDAVAVLSGDYAPGDRTEAYTLKGSILQDLGIDGSISEWTWEHAGEEMAFSFTPSTAAGKTVNGRCTVEATAIGGDVAANATADFEYACTSKPSIEAASEPAAPEGGE